MRTIAVANAKGGVGKTTTALVMADILAREYDQKVLLIDLDPQLNASRSMGVYEKGNPCIAHLLVMKKDELDIRDVIRKSSYEGIDVIPCDKGLEEANKEILMNTTGVMQYRLRSHIRQVEAEYDYCILDCPTKIKDPATVNGFAITDDILIPVTIDGYSIEGVKDTMSVIADMEEINDKVQIVGVFINRYENTRIAHQMEEGLREQLGDKLFDTHIRKSIKISETTFYTGVGLIEYARKAPVLDDFRNLVTEYLKKR